MPESSGIGIWSKRVVPLPWRFGVPRVERRRPHPRGALWGPQTKTRSAPAWAGNTALTCAR